jgi:hypothetical protein
VLRRTSSSTKEKPGWRTTINIQVFRGMEADVDEERAS